MLQPRMRFPHLADSVWADLRRSRFQRLLTKLAFQRRYEETASPLQWTFTRKDLATLLAKIENQRLASAA